MLNVLFLPRALSGIKYQYQSYKYTYKTFVLFSLEIYSFTNTVGKDQLGYISQLITGYTLLSMQSIKTIEIKGITEPTTKHHINSLSRIRVRISTKSSQIEFIIQNLL